MHRPVTARAGRRAIGLAAPVLLAPVPVELRVGPARPRAADRPEVLDGRELHDPLLRHADLQPVVDRNLIGPEPELRVTRVHGYPDAIPVEPHVLLDELGGEREDPTTGERISDPRPQFMNALRTLPKNNRVIVTCRSKDYEEIGQKIALKGALTLKALSDSQIRDYLRDLPELWDALQIDEKLEQIRNALGERERAPCSH